jgi:hypothetical protein
MTAFFRVPVLRIKQCPDTMRWYRGLVGQLVPHRSWTPNDGYLSAEPAGFTNFVRTEDAEPIEVMVRAEDMHVWPYSQGKHKAIRIITAPASDPRPMQTVAEQLQRCTERAAVKTCAPSCDMLGICQALPDCQDQARIDAQMAKPTPSPATGQSRAHSMAETLSSIAVGFVVSMVIQALVLPAFGHHITLAQNFWITCIFTVASVLRGYGMRRLFNRLHKGGVL